MTKREAVTERRRLEREGWADVSIMRSTRIGRGSLTYVIAAVDPATGVRTPWRAEPGEIGASQ